MPGPHLPPRQTRAAKSKKNSRTTAEQGTASCEAEGLPVQVLSASDTESKLAQSPCLIVCLSHFEVHVDIHIAPMSFMPQKCMTCSVHAM